MSMQPSDSRDELRSEDDAPPPEGQTSAQEPETKVVGTGFIPGVILLVVLAVALIIVVVQNTQDAEFKFLWIDVETPLIALLLGAALFTFIADQVIGFVWRFNRRRNRRMQEELKRLRKS